MNTPLYDIIIIGAGASGLVCARECAKAGKKTLLLEKESLPARKILASGNGRCNLTNAQVNPTYYHGDAKLIAHTLQQFAFQDCLNYFSGLGVLTREEEQGRIFPTTGKSTAVSEALKLAVMESGAEIRTSAEVTQIKRGKFFSVLTRSKEMFLTHHVVLACGSCAFPQIGGSSSGYELARRLGHSIIPPRPALSALCIKETAFARLTGIRSQVRLTAFENGRILDQSEGEVLFTHYGLNGPAALNVSSSVSRALTHGEVSITLNFLPQISEPQTFLRQRLTTFGTRRPKDFFAGLLHENISNLLIDFTGSRKNIPMEKQTPNTLHQLCTIPAAWPITVTGIRPWNEAMAATGGVNTREINYNTFESLKCPGVYITGELLDVAGKSGGFNLHFAWASGWIAARSMTERK